MFAAVNVAASAFVRSVTALARAIKEARSTVGFSYSVFASVIKARLKVSQSDSCEKRYIVILTVGAVGSDVGGFGRSILRL